MCESVRPVEMRRRYVDGERDDDRDDDDRDDDARRDMGDSVFRQDRLQPAVTRLGERLRQVRAHEEDQRRQLAYDKARVERDRLTEALVDMSPAVFRLANIMAHIDASDRAMAQVNSALPVGAEHLRSAVVGASPAFAHMFEELIVRDVFLAIASAPDRFHLKPAITRGKGPKTQTA